MTKSSKITQMKGQAAAAAAALLDLEQESEAQTKKNTQNRLCQYNGTGRIAIFKKS